MVAQYRQDEQTKIKRDHLYVTAQRRYPRSATAAFGPPNPVPNCRLRRYRRGPAGAVRWSLPGARRAAEGMGGEEEGGLREGVWPAYGADSDLCSRAAGA
jgi:hypothetical protein